MPQLTIKQWPVALDAAHETVLNTALAAGVPYPHGCRIGECGFCKSELLSGEVSMSAYDEAVLPETERAKGLILACRARPCSDVTVAWLSQAASAGIPVQRIRAQVTNIEQVTPHIRRLFVWPERHLQFAAGQYARIGFADIEPRSYSMANDPQDPVLEFHIRLVEHGEVSRHVAERLKPGDFVRIEGPYGHAHFRAGHSTPLIAVAGGSGLAPLKSIVKTALRSGLTTPIDLLFAAKSKRHVYDDVELMDLASRYPNLNFRVVLSRHTNGDPSLRPLIEVLGTMLADRPPSTLYTAGPPDLVQAVVDTALRAGFPDSEIFSDAFFGSADQTNISNAARQRSRKPGRSGFLSSLSKLFGT